MIGLDTNVLVRYLVQDEPSQAKLASKLIEQAAAENTLLFINHVVLCELVWVLSIAYDHAKATLIDLLQKILSTKQFEIEDSKMVWTALELYKKTKADFSDCLLAAKNHVSDCSYTVTFDKAALSCHFFKPCS